jgi:hypothetical protein
MITGFFTVFDFAQFQDQLAFEKQLLRPHEGIVQPAQAALRSRVLRSNMPDRSPYAPAAERPLRGRDEPEPQPLMGNEPPSESGWQAFVRGLGADLEFLLLAGALLALSAWFVLESGRQGDGVRGAHAPALLTEVAPAPAENVRPGPAFSFIGAEGRDALVPALQAAGWPSVGLLPNRVATASIEQHALLAEPVFDPLGTLQISGLPPETRLSAGAALTGGLDGASDWAVAFGDLDNLVIELPRERTMPIRATVDVRTRAGFKVTSLTVEFRDQPEAGLAEPGAAVRKSKVRPAKAVRPGSRSQKKAARSPTAAAVKPQPVFPGDAPKGQKAAGSATAAAGAPVSGFFQPDPKDSAAGGLSPELREDPRFMTLRGLGMPPSDLNPTQGPTP